VLSDRPVKLKEVEPAVRFLLSFFSFVFFFSCLPPAMSVFVFVPLF
jgi:hypothetical protein